MRKLRISAFRSMVLTSRSTTATKIPAGAETRPLSLRTSSFQTSAHDSDQPRILPGKDRRAESHARGGGAETQDVESRLRQRDVRRRRFDVVIHAGNGAPSARRTRFR